MSGGYRYRWPRPSLAVDVVALALREGALQLLTIRRGAPPFRGCWALPGGFVQVSDEGEQGEDLERAAARELAEETGFDVETSGVYLEQLYTFGAPGRDPRGRVISVVYLALVPADVPLEARAGDDAAHAAWRALDEVLDEGAEALAFDHAQIIDMARERLRGKVDWVPEVAAGLAPRPFTRPDLQAAHEAIKGQALDRSNFAKRFRRWLDEGRFEPVEGTQNRGGAGRPAQLYQVAESSLARAQSGA